MISNKTIYSLVQFLQLQQDQDRDLLLKKHEIQAHNPYDPLDKTLLNCRDEQIMELLKEITSTSQSLRYNISPKYQFEERMADLAQCLLLDGYIQKDGTLLQIDPSISDAAPFDDDLISELSTSKLPNAQDIIKKINDSTTHFRAISPDYNASLTNARVALETLAKDIAEQVALQNNSKNTYDQTKWGSVINFLATENEITREEEKGLIGVFGFLSPGAHRPIGIPEDQMTRLGRSMALNMCWFLLQNHLIKKRNHSNIIF